MDVHVKSKTEKEYKYARAKAKKEMQQQVVVFALMIMLTFVAFALAAAGYSARLVVPIVLLFATFQVVLQLYYFMHWNEKGTGIMQFFMYGAILVAFTVILTFLTIVWI